MLVRAEAAPTGADVLLGLGGGLLGGVGITSLYRGLAEGRMAIVAPVTGVLAAVIPVLAGIVLEGLPGPVVLAGIVLAIAAVLLVSRVKDEAGGRAGLGLALLAGTSIGLFGIVLSQMSDGHVFGPLAIVRTSECVLMLLFLRVTGTAWRPPRSLLPALAALGLADMAGNAFYILAVQTGALAVAAVVSSMYPVTTVVLAAVVLRERVTRSHTVGIVLAGIAIVLIGVGSH
jgi:drug/metabolite transporter (DMT)-like permease